MSEATQSRILALGNGVWLDEIRKEGLAPIKDIPGGSVTFATLGARLFTPKEPASIGMVFNAGGDFPSAIMELFRSWSISLTVHHQSDKPSARGLVFYDKANDDRKGFQRLTEPLPVTIKDVQGTTMLRARSFHFFGTAEYVEEQVWDMYNLRRQANYTPAEQPFIIWEPQAKSCRPDSLCAHQDAAGLVSVFSPNHEELAGFFDDNAQPTAHFDKQRIERQARAFVDAGIGAARDGCVVVRAAGHGCVVMTQDMEPVWLPSFYASDRDAHMVVDATGAGNAFLGAFAIGWQESGSYVEAAKYGQVAASFVIEQVGLPVRFGHGELELWNCCAVRERLAVYRARLDG
ncbi:hypothetical protein LTR36_009305 [Oleoguttula mirabilis]|uniref:Carbohydrate kinase PfkB domain-containing protein n=1 Tax=Oleoguttula mirabilis TaxID=1507867 RepID=A0AAV9J5Z6_9PEZI|nr:hypothetical protein LTR36_009305 [Oleoguttula mirabilis]